MLKQIIIQNNILVHQMDVKSACPNADIDGNFIEQPAY